MRLPQITLLALSLILALAAPAFAAEEPALVRYMVPVTGSRIAGANGSLWTTELTVHNSRGTQMFVHGDICGGVISSPPCDDNVYIAPRTSKRVELVPASFSQGAFIYLPLDPSAGPVPMTLRSRDLSKTAESFGTEVPVVRDSDFAQFVVITDVPTDTRYRATLRIYNSSEAPRIVEMRVYTLTGTQPIETRSIELSGVNILVFNPTPFHPAYAQVDPLSPLVRASGERVRIEIEDPIRHVVSPPPPPIWALVSVTNNDTQQVTTITPHP